MTSSTELARELYTRSREQYNNKNIKQYISLESEDNTGEKVSVETCLLAQRQASEPQATSIEVVPFESETSSPGSQQQPRAEGGNVITSRELSSRWSGISVHHVRTAKGVKIGITLQRPDWQTQGRTLQITAELKRYDRMREVRALEDDSENFVQYITQLKQMLYENRDRTVCLGRAHQRGARRAWIHDTLVLAHTQDNQVISIGLHIEGEDIVIKLDQPMSEQQQRVYHSTGYQGRLCLQSRSPRIDELPTRQHDR
jgi:hypothetical protein